MDNLNLSPIIAGVMRWGQWGANHSIRNMACCIEAAYSSGITSFDHADIYGGYTTEKIFGKAFEKTQIPREHVQFISKYGIQYPCDERALPLKYYEYDPNYLEESVSQSLEHLKTDYLDVLLLHRPSPLLDVEQVGKLIRHLIKVGKIRAFGVSNFNLEQIRALEKYTPIAYNQIEISLTYFNPLINGTLDELQSREIRPMAWSPMGSLFLEKNEKNIRLKSLLSELSTSYQVNEFQLLLAWLLRHPSKILPVIGSSQPERIRSAMGALDIQLSTVDWFRLLTLSQGHKVP